MQVINQALYILLLGPNELRITLFHKKLFHESGLEALMEIPFCASMALKMKDFPHALSSFSLTIYTNYHFSV